MLRVKTRILAILVAALVFTGGAAVVSALLPSQTSFLQDGWNWGYVYSGAKSQSTAFVTANMQQDDVLLFGSSELSTPPSLVPEIPAVVFGQNNYGLQLACIGEAYDQSLWHAIAAGAYAPRISNKKVVVIVSPSWFFDGGVDNSLFQTRFSYPLYHQFAENPAISEESRAYLRTRLLDQGIDEATVHAAFRADPLAALNDVAFSAASNLRLRNNMRSLEGTGIERVGGKELVPQFEKWREHALSDAQQRSTNEWGFSDDFWENNVGIYKDQIKDRLSGETFTDTPEYDDFGFFLRICQETGLEPLVVLAPLSGTYYDWVGIDTPTRQACYTHVLQIADAYGAQVADFSGKEYETYFLNDQVHFGWLGWLDVEEAIYNYAKGN